MPIQASPVLPTTIAALAVSLSLSTLALSTSTLPAISAPAAETCLTAPKGAAPQGSHWYYRLEQGSQRKCWRLVRKDKGQSATAQTDPQGEVDEEAETVATAPAATPPGAKKSPSRVTEPAPKAAPDLVSKYASDTSATPP